MPELQRTGRGAGAEAGMGSQRAGGIDFYLKLSSLLQNISTGPKPDSSELLVSPDRDTSPYLGWTGMGRVWKQPEGKPTLRRMLSPVMSDGDDSDLAPRVVYYTFPLTR